MISGTYKYIFNIITLLLAVTRDNRFGVNSLHDHIIEHIKCHSLKKYYILVNLVAIYVSFLQISKLN